MNDNEKDIVDKYKLQKIFLIIIGILIILIFLVNILVPKEKTIEEKIGIADLMNLSTTDYTYVKELSVNKYFRHIKSKEYDIAYKMLSSEYKNIKSYEDFVKEAEKLNVNDVTIKDIKSKGDYVYAADITFGGTTLTNTKYLIFADEFNEKIFYISPDKFIKYYISEYKMSKNNMKFKVLNYTVNSDTIIMNVEIENKSKKDNIEISQISIISNLGKTRDSLKEKIIIEPRETETIRLVFNTKYEFINKMQITRDFINQNKIKIYTFGI